MQRSLTPNSGSDPRSTYRSHTPPLLVVHSPPVSRRGSLTVNELSAVRKPNQLDEVEDRQEEPNLNLDPNSIPLRIIYSPSVSRSGSLGQSDRPSIVLSQNDDSIGDVQLLAAEHDSSLLRSFEAPTVPESYVHRRSRANSYSSIVESRLSTTLSIARRSPSPTGRLAFEELGNRDHFHAPPVFVAFPTTKWFRPMLAAKTILAIVCCAVLGNLIYT